MIPTVKWLHTIGGTLQQKQVTHPKEDIYPISMHFEDYKANEEASHNYYKMISVSFPSSSTYTKLKPEPCKTQAQISDNTITAH